MVNNLDLAKELFLGKQAVIADIANRLAFYPDENRRLSPGDILTIEYVGKHHGKIMMGWKCDPKFYRDNIFLGRDWNMLPIYCFEPRPYEPPLDWRLSLEEIIPNC